MNITEFVEQTSKGQISLTELTALAADPNAYGADVAAAFETQLQLRAAVLNDINRDCEAAGRGDMLADENKKWGRNLRERDAILGLKRSVEQRGESAYAVPASQTVVSRAQTSEDLSPVLTTEQRCATSFAAVTSSTSISRRFNESALLRARHSRVRGWRSSRAERPGTACALRGHRFCGRILRSGRPRRFLHRSRARCDGCKSRGRGDGADDIGQPVARPCGDGRDGCLEKRKLRDHSERHRFGARHLRGPDAADPRQVVRRVVGGFQQRRSDSRARDVQRAGAGTGSGGASRNRGIAPEPRGVINQSGVVFQAFNDTGSPADGIPGDYDFLIDAIGSCLGQNFTPNARIYNSQIATILAKLKDTTGQPLQVPAAVAAVPEFRTNQIPNTLGDLGSPAEDDATVAFVGDFRELMVGLRTSFRMEVSRQAAEASSSAFSNLQVWIRAYLRADIQLAHPKAFTVVEGIHTS